VIIFIGAFYLINMLMAVVSLAYAEEGDREDVETKMAEEEKKKEEVHYSNSNNNNLFHYRSCLIMFFVVWTSTASTVGGALCLIL
jgi:hypothetical protein